MLSENDLADQIHKNGWRQGSVFDPSVIGIGLPHGFILAEGELLIVCTQSCSVVSQRFNADPSIEAMVIKGLTKYNAKAPEATGVTSRAI